MLTYDPNLPLFSIHLPKTAGTSFERVLQTWFNDRPFPNLANRPRLQKILTPWNLDFLLQRMMGCRLYFHYGRHVEGKPPRVVPLSNKYGILQQKRPECLHGHFEPHSDKGTLFDYYPDARQFITFLRDPLEMQLSHYFYNKKMIESGQMFWRGKKVTQLEYNGDINRWVAERGFYMLHFMPMKFSKDNYKEVIHKYFVHIGVTEIMEQSIKNMASKLNVEPMVVPKENVTKRNIEPSTEAVSIFKEKHQLEYMIYEYALSLNQIEN